MFEGQCYIDIHGCSQYVFGNICRKCEQGFILVNNECCDKHCMAKIFKNYQVANEQTEMTEEQKFKDVFLKDIKKLFKYFIHGKYGLPNFLFIRPQIKSYKVILDIL